MKENHRSNFYGILADRHHFGAAQADQLTPMAWTLALGLVKKRGFMLPGPSPA
jgi:hypothetical protein